MAVKPVLTGVIEGKNCYSRKIQRRQKQQHTQYYSRKNLLEKRKKIIETVGLEVEPQALSVFNVFLFTPK